MSTPFLGQLQIFGFGKTPSGWAACNGQSLPINQNQALFALLGTTYGGNGTTTFNLPNLQGTFTLSPGAGYTWGQTAGEEQHSLTQNETPSHNHPMVGSAANASPMSPAGAFPGITGGTYSATSNTTLGTGSSIAGGSQPHENRPPYLALNICIALQGVYPSRN